MQLSVLLIAGAVSVSTAPGADYDEDAQGDLTQHGNNGSLLLLHLDLGPNVIRGSTHIGDLSDVDAFRFRVPTGAVLDLNSIVYEYEVTDVSADINAFGPSLFVGTGDPTSMPLAGTGFSNGNNFFLFSDGTIPGIEVSPSPVSPPFFQVIDSQVDLGFPAVPLESGIYWFGPGAGWFGGGSGAVWNYTITLTVTPAP